jgi:indole-3-glycerol phosphate synthase
MNILAKIVARKEAEVADRTRRVPLWAIRDQAPPPPRDFVAALRRPGISAIAEIKRRSPSRGVLCACINAGELAAAYERGGARAVSVLTDRDFFGGSEEDLDAARTETMIPILRKDFTIDPYQIYESRALGASAILLIVRILEDSRLQELLAVARECKLAALVETHNEREVERALVAGAEIIGVNARDLDTFKVDPAGVLSVKQRIPASVIAVAESGIQTRDDVLRLEKAGFDAILVGETLVRSPDPAAKLRELIGGAA